MIFRCVLKGLDAPVERICPGDEGFHIDRSRFHQRECPVVNVGIPKNRFHTGFFRLSGNNGKRYRFKRDAYQDDTAAGTKEIECALNRLAFSARLENDVSAPSIGTFIHDLFQVLFLNVHANDWTQRGREIQLGLQPV